MKKILIITLLFQITGYFGLQANNLVKETANLSDTLKSYALKEVIITSSPKETDKLSALPISTSMLLPEQIDGMKITGIKNLSMLIPNFFIADYGSKLSTPIYLRGLGERATGQAVGLYVDNMPYLDKSAFDFDFTDIQYIEVLRGPQGTLYGRNTIGGIVNIYTHSPLNYNCTKLMLSGGNYGLMQAKGTFSRKIDDKTGISISGYYDGNDGFFTNDYTGEKADKLNSAGGRFRLDYKINPSWKLQYMFNYDYVDQGAFPYGEYKNGDIQNPNFNFPSSYLRQVVGNNLNLSYENKNILFSSTTGYQYIKDDMRMDTDYSPRNYFMLNQNQLVNAFTQEFSIKSNSNRNYQWSFGTMGFYDGTEINSPVTFGEDGVKNILQRQFDILKEQHPDMPYFKILDKTIVVPGDFETPSYGAAVYHQSTYNNLFVKGLSGTVGIRFDYERDVLKYNTSFAENTLMTMQMKGMPRHIIQEQYLEIKMDGEESMEFTQVLPKFALKYAFNGDKYIYASATKGYKPGGYNVEMFSDLVQNSFRGKYDSSVKVPSVQEAAGYNPEFSWNYELGFKGELIKGFLYSELSAFYIDIRDVQLTQFVSSGQGRIVANAPKAESYGAELSLTANLFDGFNLSANYGYTHATFKDYKSGKVDYSGKYLPYAPQNTFSLSAVYNKNFHNKWLDNFNIQAQYNGAGKIYWTEDNDTSQDFYGVVNAKVSARKGIVGLAFWTKNLFNKDYAAFYFESMGRSLAQKGRPMQCGVDLNITF